MKRIIMIAFALAAICTVKAVERPKLIIGIIVDQMRWDYLNYYDYTFGDDGFRRLLGGGYSFDNCMIDYIPTVTAVGHTAVYTGSVPAITGIAGNNFYIGDTKTYCCADNAVSTVGSTTDEAGRMSPRNLRVTTMTDAVKMAQDGHSKTVGISLKDRGAILPAGHTADAAYWFDNAEGVFITSTYYMDTLPAWVREFNEANHRTEDVRYNPEGDNIVALFAMAAIEGESLGQRSATDFLTVSFSSTDYVGHRYGTRSEQTEEVYRELDRQIAALLKYLDEKVGTDNYLLFLSADHAGAHNADEMQAMRVPAGKWRETSITDELNAWLQKTYETTERPVRDMIEYRIYLDHNAIRRMGAEVSDVKNRLTDYLTEGDSIAYAVDFNHVAMQTIPNEIRDRIVRGYNPKRSGDIQIILQPGWYAQADDGYEAGTNHGVWCPYDSHIPLIFYGWNVPEGHSEREVHITDIAPTVCSMLHVQMPDGCIGQPVSF